LGERVEFVWNDEAKFKHLSTQDAQQRAALTSFGMSIGRLLLKATQDRASTSVVATAGELRNAILASSEYVDLGALVGTCWAIGIPVICLRVFPLDTKSMHAMVVSHEGRSAVLLARDATYPSPVAFTLAHELGHIMLGHLQNSPALIDLDDPLTAQDQDAQEEEADRFALMLLTGSESPEITTNVDRFNAPTLADAVLKAAPQYRVEPGTLALCLAHARRAWPVAFSALRFIYDAPKPVWREINGLADMELDWDSIGDEAAHYLRNVMLGDG
jgi:hypothetical protein